MACEFSQFLKVHRLWNKNCINNILRVNTNVKYLQKINSGIIWSEDYLGDIFPFSSSKFIEGNELWDQFEWRTEALEKVQSEFKSGKKSSR